MWNHYSSRILLICLIPYVCYFGLFLLLILYNERYFSESEIDNYNYQDNERKSIVIICAINIVFIIYFLYIALRRVMFLKLQYFRSMWSWLDMSSAALNIAIVVMTLQ